MTKATFAKAEDIPQLVALGYQEFQENNITEMGVEVDFDKSLIAMTNLVLEHVVLVIRNEENPKIIDGVLACQIAPPWFSSSPVLSGLFLYVKKEHRSKGLGKDLLSSVKEYAIMNRLSISFGLTTKVDLVRKRKLLESLGFDDWGSSFIWVYKEE